MQGVEPVYTLIQVSCHHSLCLLIAKMNLGPALSVSHCQELCREYNLHVRDLKADGKGPLAYLLTLIETRKHNILEVTRHVG